MAVWLLVLCSSLAVIAAGFLTPRKLFPGQLEIGLVCVAFGCFLASVGVASVGVAGSSAVSVGRRVAGWVAGLVGAALFPLVANFGVAAGFNGGWGQEPNIRHFPTLGNAFWYAFGDPRLVTVAAVAPLGLAVGLWALGRPIMEAAGCYLLCMAAYPVIVLLLHVE